MTKKSRKKSCDISGVRKSTAQPGSSTYFFKNVIEHEISTTEQSKEAFLLAGIMPMRSFRESIIPYISSVIPKVSGSLHSLDYAKDMSDREALLHLSKLGMKPGNILTPDDFAGLFLAIFDHDSREKEANNKILLTDPDHKESINVFFVRIRRKIFMIWVDPNFSSDFGHECALFAFEMDAIEDRLSGIRVFV
ncbi:MAG: hypothetical protein WCO21_02625 [bacterium]|nr:hypothetical protein [Candidatus Jorgensenbacteria bacterium]